MKITDFINNLLNGKKIRCSHWTENQYCYWERSTNTIKNSDGNDVEWTVEDFHGDIYIFNGETVRFDKMLVGTRFRFVPGGEVYTKIDNDKFNCVDSKYKLNYCHSHYLVSIVDVV